MTYSLTEYGQMIADRARMDPYAFALKAAVNPDSVVLDIGAATGIHALLACKFGAKQVFAVETSDAIHLARELAQENGFQDRIKFIQDLSTNISLPEQANIVVSDLRGILPPFNNHIPSIVDARSRHLVTGGRLIPQADTLSAALVNAPLLYRDLIKPWTIPYGLHMEAAKERVLNQWGADNTDLLAPRNLLAEPQVCFTLDYYTIETPNLTVNELKFEAAREATAHGWLIWFETELTEEIGFSNGPGSRKIPEVYGRGFFPLLDPVKVKQRDVITLDIGAEWENGEYMWRWATRVHSGSGSGKKVADYKQSTRHQDASKSRYLEENASTIRPALSDIEQLELFALRQMDGARTINEIALQLQEKYPNRFRDRNELLTFVYDLARR